MQDLSLHILDIVENSIDAGAKNIEISICEDRETDLLSVEITDDGRGMSEAELEKATDPFWTTRQTRRVGLGLSLLEQAARAAGGELSIKSQPGVGTTVEARFQHSHIDRKPLGDVGSSLLALIVANPDVDFTYVHQQGGSEVRLSTEDIRAQLGPVSIAAPEGIGLLRRRLEKVRVKTRF